MIISRRLQSLLYQKMLVKMNGTQYEVYLKAEVRNELELDSELYFEVRDFNYFCFNKHSKITCWPLRNGDQPLNERGQWKLEGRQEMKPGKFLAQFDELLIIYDSDTHMRSEVSKEIATKIRARACEVFADAIRGINNPIDFNTTSDICKIYETPAHAASGYLRNSCMRPGSTYRCNNFARFYNTIPNLQIAHKIVDGELLFRALLWQTTNCKTHEPVMFLDRIYGSASVNLQLIEHAKALGWAWRGFEDHRIHNSDDSNYLTLEVPITQESYHYLQDNGGPYVDTLFFLKRRDDLWILSNSDRNYLRIIQSCDGDPLETQERCVHCNSLIDPDDTHHFNGDPYCSTCFEECTTVCADCGERYSYDDIYTLRDDDERYCTSCLDDMGAVPCYICGRYTLEENSIVHNNRTYCEHCFSYHSRTCSICGERHLRNKLSHRVLIDGHLFEFVCEHCKGALSRCNTCGATVSGVLKLTMGHGWTETKFPVYCDTCLTTAQELTIAEQQPQELTIAEQNLQERITVTDRQYVIYYGEQSVAANATPITIETGGVS